MKYIESPSSPTEMAPRPAIGFFRSKAALRVLLVILALAALVVIRDNELAGSLGSRAQTFVTIFLSIFIEAVPFLLAGSIVSGLLEVYVSNHTLYRFVPRHPAAAALVGGGLGLIFPVCECGVVPVTRRLYLKGLPISMGIAFMLAAPVINPIVLASTYAAFGWGPILYGRVILSFLIASMIGFLFHFADPADILRPDQLASSDHHHHHDHSHDHADAKGVNRFWKALSIGGDDFFDMGRYLIAGSMLAAAMQTLIPQPFLLALGAGSATSIFTMMMLAFVLSVCSTVDSFLALAFVNSFPPAAILAFLVFGPMVDIKSSLMFLGVFKRRVVLYLILLPLMATLMITVYLNLNVSW
ncbi:MAG: permease [Anaerolineales bacterium]|nr:permease [Anaerolineales bacterium]